MGLGSSLFARHYSGSRGFFPFLRLLRCFSSPACHCSPYVFRREHARITTRRFPHSEIPGSKVGQHLTRAYRSRPRPSSALSAKASTVCSCSLDRKEHVFTTMEFSRCARPESAWQLESSHQHQSFKTQQRELHQIPRATAGEACVVRGLAEHRGRRNSRRDRTPDGQKSNHQRAGHLPE
jgi:hypothetical protein